MTHDNDQPIPQHLSDAKKRLFELLLKEKIAAKAQAPQDIITGVVAITPPQAHEFDIPNRDRHMFNLALLLEVHLPLPRALLEQIIAALLAHHDALRLCSVHSGGHWQQFIAPPPARPPVEYIDLRSLHDRAAQKAALEAHIATLQRSFDLAVGPLLKVAFFDLGPGQPARLLLLVHHIACDHYSTLILAEDFVMAYRQLSSGQPLKLPAKTTSYLHWSHYLASYARSAAIEPMLTYWLGRNWQAVRSLPVDHPDGVNIGSAATTLVQQIDLRSYPHLANHVLKSQELQLPHVLIAAVAQALIDWTGGSTALISLCQHGRTHLFRDIDISRTVGWFSYQFPLLLDLAEADSGLALLHSVKTQIESVPNQGLDYGLLRYMGKPAAVTQLQTLPEADLFLNIRVGTQMHIPGFAPASEDCGNGSSPTIIRPRYLYLNIDVNDGQIVFDCLYNTNIHRRTTIETFIRACIAQIRALNDALATT